MENHKILALEAIAHAQIMAMAMQAENDRMKAEGKSAAYDYSDFASLAETTRERVRNLL